ncbi:MAG: hypothetical protein U1F98_04940 [Verrucomicrobiota bacterium]
MLHRSHLTRSRAMPPEKSPRGVTEINFFLPIKCADFGVDFEAYSQFLGPKSSSKKDWACGGFDSGNLALEAKIRAKNRFQGPIPRSFYQQALH